MKHVARRAARLSRALIGATALGACLANPAAAAQTVQFDAQCGAADGRVRIEAAIPDRWNRTSPPERIRWRFQWETPNLTPIELPGSYAELSLRVRESDRQSRLSSVAVPIEGWGKDPAYGSKYRGEVDAIAPTVAVDGPVTFDIEAIKLVSIPGAGSAQTCILAEGQAAPRFSSAGYALGDAPASTEVANQCKFPLWDKEPGRLRLSATIPEVWDLNSPPSSVSWNLRYESSSRTGYGFWGLHALSSLTGSATVDIQAKTADGSTSVFSVPFDLSRASRAAEPTYTPIHLTATTALAPPLVRATAATTFSVTGVHLNLAGNTRDGAPFRNKPLTSDFDGNPVTDSDGDQLTFDVYCRLDAGQDQTLATTRIVSGPATERGVGTLRGTLGVPKLFASQAPLNGSYDLVHKRIDHTVSGDLALSATSARLVGSVTGRIELMRSGPATGALVDGQLTLKQLVRIRVGEVKLFGAVPIAGGVSCQAKSPSLITLKSTDPVFTFEKGGALEGTFDLSDLNGCPTLAGIVNSASASTGNTIRVVLTPRSVTTV